MKSSVLQRLLLMSVQAISLSATYTAQVEADTQFSSGDASFRDGGAVNEDFQFKSGVQLQTGQQRVDQSGTLFSSSYDNARGANLSDAADRYRLQVFGYQTQPSVRYDGLSVNYIPAKNSTGASLQLNDMRQWKVQSGFLTNDQSISAGPYEPQSSTWNVAADRQWMNDSVHTRIEYARSQNSAYSYGSLADHAVDVSFNTLSPDLIELPLFDNWTAGARYRSIGNGYAPAADIQLPSGLQEANVFFNSSIRNFSFDFGWREENLNAIESVAQLASNESRSMAAITYAPTIGSDNLLRRFFGAPSLTAHYHKIDAVSSVFDTGGGVRSESLFSDIDEHGLTLQLAKRLWQWSVKYQESSQHPRRGALAGNDQRSIVNGDRNATSLSVGLTPSQRLALKANAKWRHQLVAGAPTDNDQQLYNVAANFDVVPNTCSLSMQYDYALSQGTYLNGGKVSTGLQNQVSSAAVSWRAITFNGSRPAMDLSFRSSFGRLDDQLAMNIDERWSAQLSMKMYWGQQQL